MIKNFLKIFKNEFVQNVKNVVYDGKMYPGILNTCTEEIKLILVHLQFFCKKFLPDCKQTADVEDDVPRKNSEHYEEIWTATNAVGCSVFFFSFSIFFFVQLFFFCIITFKNVFFIYILPKHFFILTKLFPFIKSKKFSKELYF